jgi:hypothetical protein
LRGRVGKEYILIDEDEFPVMASENGITLDKDFWYAS